MAAGEGGFSTQINGFNKNEVTEYIGKISKEKLGLQNELNEAETKMKAAEKRAEDAEKKVEELKADCDKQIADLNAQVKEERRKSEEYINQIDDLKRKLKNGGGIKESDEIISEAKRKAQQIIEEAKRGISGAASTAKAAVDTTALMNALRGLQSTVSAELQKFGAKAGEILNTSFGDEKADEPAGAMSSDDGFFASMDDASAESDFGMSGGNDAAEVKPLADPELPKNEMDDNFASELLAQSVPDPSVSMEDMFNSNQPDADIRNDEPVGFDMGGSSDSGSGQSDLDAMNALLGQMSASLGGSDGSSMEMDEPAGFSEPAGNASPADDNPWANLQAQLNAMEMSGNFGSDDSGNDAQPEMTNDAQAAPSADDADIWNFGMDLGGSSSTSSSDDMNDDMSADLFAGF